MAEEEPTETTSLLSRIRTEEDIDSKQKDFQSHLRRNSTTLGPPFHDEEVPPPEAASSSLAIYVVVPISLLGVFVANADGSLVVASSQQIASDFDELYNAQWLVTSFTLAQCASQPLYGKLSNVFGRKINLVVAYTFFGVGCFLCGAGSAYWQVLAGRAISGIGGAGMTALVSIIIADLVPVRDVAAWRSYVNVAATIGRAMGGPVGGWLCDTISWRWCFYGQVPIAVVGLVLIIWKMPTKISTVTATEDQTFSQKIKRIDFVGAILLASTIISFLLMLDFAAGDAATWLLISVSGLCLLLAISFVLVEHYWAKEPILPLRLLVTRAALTSYLLTGFQMAGQFGLFYSVPVYFQVVAGTNVAQAGLHLVPAVVGNTTAFLLSGLIISRTGRYKAFTIGSSLFACIGYALVVVRWRGDTNWLEACYVFCGGFGSGAIQSTAFIHLAASLTPEDMAIAGTTVYLAANLFLIIGLQSATTIQHVELRKILNTTLEGNDHKDEIIKLAISSVQSIRLLPDTIRRVVVHAYIDSLSWTFGASLVYASLGLIAAISLRERALA